MSCTDEIIGKHNPMRPTARGNALLQALDHPAVRALALPQRDASQPTDQDPPPC